VVQHKPCVTASDLDANTCHPAWSLLLLYGIGTAGDPHLTVGLYQ
jgi:hypothetical protein